MKGLKKLVKGFEACMCASAFAEEGDAKTAKEVMSEMDESSEGGRRPAFKDITKTLGMAETGESVG